MQNNLKLYITLFLLSILSLSCFANDQNKIFTIVIDPGHGGKDVGAVDNGQKEKEINLGVSTRLANLIKKNLRNVKVVLTREDDTFITLQQRAEIANKNRGDLFISIHTNSVDKSNPNRKNIEGASVYALGLHKDQNNLQVARRENSVIELENNYEQKYSGFDPNKDESYIIFEMAQKSNLSQSLKFANLAQQNLVAKSGRKDKGVKQAGFWVLWATSMPAVLVELDFICNPNSAEFLGSDKGQEKLAQALYEAVEKFLINTTNKTTAHAKPNNKTSLTEKNVAQENLHKGSEEVSSMPVLHEAVPEVKVVTHNKSNYSRVATARKRRSISSKRNSDLQDFETPLLEIHSEADRMILAAKEETPIVEEDVPAHQYHPVSKKKDKKSKSISNTTKNLQAKANTSKAPEQRIVNNKVVLLTKNDKGNTVVTVPSNSASYSSVSQKMGTKIKTIYKVLILESNELLRLNDKRFCGLKPVKSFRENNKYKYTYGESENREEIESILEKVKTLIPGAHIISNLR